MTTTANRRLRALIYTRVSKDASGIGRSNTKQHGKCAALADLRDWDVVGHEMDRGISAYTGQDRPGWNAVLQRIAAGEVDVVVAYHLDRMTRSMSDLESLITLAVDHNVGVATVVGDIDMSTDMGRMIARILAAVARAEVERKAQRARDANEQAAREGKPHAGPRPFGYAADRVSIVDFEADAIRKAARDTLDGVPLGETARNWSALRYVTGQGNGTWSRQALAKLLVSPRYVGDRVYRGEVVAKGVWAPILDRETHTALVALLSDPARVMNPKGRGRTPTTLLTGIARCGTCEGSVKGRTYQRQGVNAGSVPKYACLQQCTSTPRADADNWVTDNVVALLSDPRADLLTIFAGADSSDDSAAEADTLRERLDGLAKAYAAGAVTLSQLTAGTAPLREALARLEAKAVPVQAGRVLADLDLGTALVVEQFADLPLARQRAIVDLLFDVKIQRRASKWDDRHVSEVVVVKRRERAAA